MKFIKMEGLGNDYIYIDCTNKTEDKINEIIKTTKKISDRHFGIGSDGLILICKSDIADFRMRMFNSDGSEAEMCGNGIRCVAKFVYDNNLTNKKSINIETLAGIKKIDVTVEDGKVSYATVNMGKPILEPEKIPVISKENPVKKLKLKAFDKEFTFTCVSMGNPHAVTVIKNVDDFDIEKYGPLLEINEHFPRKSNIEFIEIIDKTHIKMRVWERGAGETLACGTGACAVCVAATLNNLIEEKKEIKIDLLGGTLRIKWDNEVYMTGPAKTVFSGDIDEKE
jgi:diaminopimelate epimerase